MVELRNSEIIITHFKSFEFLNNFAYLQLKIGKGLAFPKTYCLQLNEENVTPLKVVLRFCLSCWFFWINQDVSTLSIFTQHFY